MILSVPLVGAVHQLQPQTEHHADHQADSYSTFFCQAPLFVAGLRQQQKERDVNTSTLITRQDSSPIFQ